MALKDHLVDSTKLSEEQIETVIAGRIKFDPTRKTVVLLPTARQLSTRSRILIYLTALKGWRFVLPKESPEDNASPKDISRAIGALGETVRPILSSLVSSGILHKEGTSYSVPSHTLPEIGDEIETGSSSSSKPESLNKRPVKRGRVTSKRNKPTKNSPTRKTTRPAAGTKSARGNSSKPSPATSFKGLLDSGWFKTGRTTKELKEKLHEMTVIIPLSQLPRMLIDAYRQGKLDRKKETVNGKNVWVYTQK